VGLAPVVVIRLAADLDEGPAGEGIVVVPGVAVSALASVIQKVLLKEERGAVDGIRIQTAAMTAAAAMGTAFVHNACNCADCST